MPWPLKPDYQNTVAHQTLVPLAHQYKPTGGQQTRVQHSGPLLRGSSVNETLEQETKIQLCELVAKSTRGMWCHSDFEPIREVGDKQEDRVREKESKNWDQRKGRESKQEKREAKSKDIGNPSERTNS